MATPTLLRQKGPLAKPSEQRRLLEPNGGQKPFRRALLESGLYPLRAAGIEVLQINVGKLCNGTCSHCHVDAGPDRREIMTRETIEACIRALAESDVPTLDVTGGAPEMNPHFRRAVEEARRLGRHVIDRSNLTILLAPGFEDLPEFLAGHQVQVVASLPCYLEENVDAQRGAGVFKKSLDALRRLNQLGYGQAESGLLLTLVYNPPGPSLPAPQADLEAAYRRELKERHGIVFNQLYAITNLPIGRFLDGLVRSGQLEAYIETLIDAYNPAAAQDVMCRTTLSVDWTGRLYDCDFNQMLDLGLEAGRPENIRDFDFQKLAARRIITGQHCYGCTAGFGSSCRGALT
ncbi:MAG: arsenosugar biosynthesis radical SAM (seleno)protein ArsS [Planctomycetota bacterium]